MTLTDPSVELTTPVADPLLPAAVDVFLHLGDLISLGHWAMVAIDMMGGPNIPEEVGEWFAGDWSEVARASDALTKLGAFCDTAARGLHSEMASLATDWEGRAASAAVGYFTDLADQLSVQAGHFRDIAHQYRGTAFGVKEMALAVGGLVESLADYAIAAGISLAAAAASSWTVVGGIAGGAAAGYSITKGALVVKQILDIRAKVWLACEALMGLIAGSLSALEGFTAVQLPGGYDHPIA